MAWHVVVVAVRTADVGGVVPDVLKGSGETLSFDEAVGPARNQGLSVGDVGGWGVVIDVGGWLERAPYHLSRVSLGTSLHLVRIAFEPAVADWADGSRVLEAAGRQPCFEHSPREDTDGEQCGMDLLRARTGLSFPADFAGASFQFYGMV